MGCMSSKAQGALTEAGSVSAQDGAPQQPTWSMLPSPTTADTCCMQTDHAGHVICPWSDRKESLIERSGTREYKECSACADVRPLSEAAPVIPVWQGAVYDDGLRIRV